MPDFEKSFDDFIDGAAYDKAEGILFSLIRASYMAGWLAAGGELPQANGARGLTREPSPDGTD